MKKLIRLTEADLHNIIRESVDRILKEASSFDDEWYGQEDYDGNTGRPGLMKSYDIGHVYDSNVEQEAKEAGYDNIADYLKYWFSETQQDTPWYWTQKYGRPEGVIFREGGIVCHTLPGGQIVIDEFAPGEAEYERDFNNRLGQGEYWQK
jgi:hypothetical protein